MPYCPGNSPKPSASAPPATRPSWSRSKPEATPVFDGATEREIKKSLGDAKLPSPGKTMLFAKMRTDPPDQVWYFGYIGSYRNGFVPQQWTGTEFLGTDSGQRYDVFVLVMDVAAADAFWKQHQSKDGSYAFAPALPDGAERAAVVRVLQGTTDDCR